MVEFRTVAIVLVVLVVLGGLLIAKPGILSSQEDITGKAAAVSQGNATVLIPSHAIEVAPGVFFLGTATKNGKMLEGYAFVNYKRGFGKPGGCNYDGKCNGWEDSSCSDCTGQSQQTSLCYSFLANGARWRTTEGYVINPSNTQGLAADIVATAFDQSISKWENASAKEIAGVGTATNATLSADFSSPDGQNEVYFGEISDRNAIAITVVWGMFRGPPTQRELSEWDIVFDQADFSWSSSGESGKMDFENIATHELGHVVGLDDLYGSSCTNETMYGYADYGETMKRTLGPGDIAGAKALYGQ